MTPITLLWDKKWASDAQRHRHTGQLYISPTLFLLFINDLLQSSSIPSHSYADDTTCHSSSNFRSQPTSEARSASRVTLSTAINAGLEGVSDWGRRNCVNFNASKTCFIPISLSNLPSDYSISFENVEIAPLTSVNILGLEISANLFLEESH